MSVACVVVAGGAGSRFGGLKQFAQLGGDTVTGHSIRAARSVASLVVLVAPLGHTDDKQGADIVVTGGGLVHVATQKSLLSTTPHAHSRHLHYSLQ